MVSCNILARQAGHGPELSRFHEIAESLIGLLLPQNTVSGT
jgi:hypothetical protein